MLWLLQVLFHAHIHATFYCVDQIDNDCSVIAVSSLSKNRSRDYVSVDFAAETQ